MTRKQLIFAGVLPLVLAVGATACACLWDSDTLQMERLRFPGVLEIITGKFVRHSQAYYEWRIKDRLKKLETTPNDPALIDDLAVGYDKLGRYDEGIAVLEKSLAADPNRYETLANLATLLFHAGRLEESKQLVQRALEINPNAHFGREKYQLLLTEYVLQSELKNAGVMCSKERRESAFDPQGFAKFVLIAKWPDYDLSDPLKWKKKSDVEIAAATKAVLGMMHFADYQAPILLEALGDLLATGEIEQSGTQLAARAYLRAAKLSQDGNATGRFRTMAQGALDNHIDFHGNGGNRSLSDLELEVSNEVAAADIWFAEIQTNEARWIAERRDVDREFAAIYYASLESTITDAEKQVQSEPKDVRLTREQRDHRLRWFAGLLCIGLPAAVVCLVAVALFWWSRRRASAERVTVPPKPLGA